MTIFDVKFEDVERVYSGRPGCGCGCRGEYYVAHDNGRYGEKVNPRMVKRVLNKLQSVGDKVGFSEPDIFFYETEVRYYWLYLKGAK